MKSKITKDYVDKYLRSWEKRHDEWVNNHLSKVMLLCCDNIDLILNWLPGFA